MIADRVKQPEKCLLELQCRFAPLEEGKQIVIPQNVLLDSLRRSQYACALCWWSQFFIAKGCIFRGHRSSPDEYREIFWTRPISKKAPFNISVLSAVSGLITLGDVRKSSHDPAVVSGGFAGLRRVGHAPSVTMHRLPSFCYFKRRTTCNGIRGFPRIDYVPVAPLFIGQYAVRP